MLWELKKCYYRIYQTVFKVAMNFLDWSEPQLLEGKGSILKLPEFVKSKGINKVLVVTDKGLMGLHLLDPMFEKLTEVGIDYVVRALLHSAAALLWTVRKQQQQELLSQIRLSAK